MGCFVGQVDFDKWNGGLVPGKRWGRMASANPKTTSADPHMYFVHDFNGCYGECQP